MCIHWSVIADEAKLRRTVLSCMQNYGMYFLYCTQYACSMWCERVHTHTHCRLISRVDLDRCCCSDLCWDFPVRTTLVGGFNLENHLEWWWNHHILVSLSLNSLEACLKMQTAGIMQLMTKTPWLSFPSHPHLKSYISIINHFKTILDTQVSYLSFLSFTYVHLIGILDFAHICVL